MLYGFGKFVTHIFVSILFKLRYEGLENIPKTSGFILASNHRRNYDPLFIAHKISQPIHYMAKIELFKNKFFAWVLREINAFPVSRGTGDTSALDTAREVIKSGEVLGMFPEGTRSKDGKLHRLRSGVALLAGQTGADILPCVICFDEKLRFRSTVKVRYGKLITAEELKIDVSDRSTMREALKLLSDSMESLLEQGV